MNNGVSANVAFVGAITTLGDNAQGILAQSIGGGGGNGGAATALSLQLGIGFNTTFNITANVAVGGSGGVGGSGSQVTVTNYADVSTNGNSSYGIEAQSVGGGGGNGGTSSSDNISPGGTKAQVENMDSPGVNLQASVSVGGGGGNGNNGGTVSLTNAGNVATEGMQAYGIFAQSVGGGGGTGGDSNNFNLVTALSAAGNKNNDASGSNVRITVGVGGSGGGASNGGAVTVNNSGAVSTSGQSGYGIFAQSVGGGGGAGGESLAGMDIPPEDLNDWKSWILPSASDTNVHVGGSGGSCGNGAQVTVANTGAITTAGDGAIGIYAQSIGGGGGVASYDQSDIDQNANNNGANVDSGFLFGINVGGAGGSAGNGGAVQVTNSGNIITYGQQAYGIYAQSIGGGGGSATVFGAPFQFMNNTPYFGMSLNLAAGTGGAAARAGTSRLPTPPTSQPRATTPPAYSPRASGAVEAAARSHRTTPWPGCGTAAFGAAHPARAAM